MIFDVTAHSSTEAYLAQAAGELCAADPKLGILIRRIGPCQLHLRRRNHYYASLVEAIIYQQLAGSAAAAILRRFRALYPEARRFPAPEHVHATPDAQLRAAGLSPQKISYIRDLTGRVIDGTFRLRSLARKDDEEVVAHLTQVKGIGRWTAEMFLMFTLGRPDVLPLNDLGILKAVQRAYGYRELPAARTLERLGRKWMPYRSIACWYLWASVDTKNVPDAK